MNVKIARSLNSVDNRGLKDHAAMLRAIAARPHAVSFIRLRARLLLALIGYLVRDSLLAREQ
jgi:hypothetical protein